MLQDFTNETPIPVGQAVGYLRQHLLECLDHARQTAKDHPSRELSLVVTKLEEAGLWLTQVEGQPAKASK